MKLDLHSRSLILVVATPAKINTWHLAYPGRVVGVSWVNAETVGVDCKVLAVDTDWEELFNITPTFSAVVIDTTDNVMHRFAGADDKRNLANLIMRGGYLIQYGLPDDMPECRSNQWSWHHIPGEFLHYGNTSIQTGLSNVCMAVLKAGPGNPTPTLMPNTWSEELVLKLPPASKNAPAWGMHEYTGEEFKVKCENDMSIMDLAASGYKANELESPPLELGTGHLGLLIASGQLAGRVSVPGREPHVMRGISRKTIHKYIDHQERTVESERVEILVRTVNQKGEIKEYVA